MLQLGVIINFKIITKSLFLICNFIVLILSFYTFFKKKTRIRDISDKTKEDEKERAEKAEEKKETQSKVEFRTIVIEQAELKLKYIGARFCHDNVSIKSGRLFN